MDSDANRRTPEVVHSYTDTAYGQLDGKNKNERNASIVVLSVVVLLLCSSVVFAAINGGKRDDKITHQSQGQNNFVEEETQDPEEIAVSEESQQKRVQRKSIPKTSSAPPYPPDLRAIYVSACNPEDRSDCECEVDHFEQNYPAEQFRESMRPGTKVAGYDEAFSKAYLACET